MCPKFFTMLVLHGIPQFAEDWKPLRAGQVATNTLTIGGCNWSWSFVDKTGLLDLQYLWYNFFGKILSRASHLTFWGGCKIASAIKCSTHSLLLLRVKITVEMQKLLEVKVNFLPLKAITLALPFAHWTKPRSNSILLQHHWNTYLFGVCS